MSGHVEWESVGSTGRTVKLHGGHPGVSQMKALAWGLVWWPGNDQDIENMVQRCTECQQGRPQSPPSPLHPWVWTTRPWTQLHIGFAGPMEGKMFLVISDPHSKWMEVLPMTTATAFTTIQQLDTSLLRYCCYGGRGVVTGSYMVMITCV